MPNFTILNGFSRRGFNAFLGMDLDFFDCTRWPSDIRQQIGTHSLPTANRRVVMRLSETHLVKLLFSFYMIYIVYTI